MLHVPSLFMQLWDRLRLLTPLALMCAGLGACSPGVHVGNLLAPLLEVSLVGAALAYGVSRRGAA